MTDIDGLPADAPEAIRAIERTDIAVAEAASELQDHPVVEALGATSEMADQPPLIALSSIVLVTGLVLRRPAIAIAGGRMLAAHLLATAMKSAIKRSVDRTRPHVLAEDDRYVVREGRINHPRYNSFPSGHTAGAVAVAEALARTAPTAALPARIWAAAIAVIQIPRSRHYVSDIAVGATIGVLADRMVRAAEAAIDRRAGR